MKNIKGTFCLLAMSVAISCSKDDGGEPKVDLTKVSLSIFQGPALPALPINVTGSNDPYATQAGQYFDFINNTLAGHAENLKQVDEERSYLAPLEPANGTATTGSNYLLYFGKDTSFNNIAYQVRDGGSIFTFEYLVNYVGTPDWLRQFYGEEAEDQSSGKLTNTDISPENRGIIETYEWTRNGDDLALNHDNHVNFQDSFQLEITINTSTRAGSVSYFIDYVRKQDIAWDANGSGTWKTYENGAISASGSW